MKLPARGALESARQDLRFGARSLRRSPVFTLVAVATLALTLGAVSSVLTLLYSLFLERLPVAHPEELVRVVATRRHGTERGPVSYPDYADLRDHSRTLAGLAAHYSTAPLFVSAGEDAEEVNGAVVSASFFPLLGVRPELGRFFRPDEDSVPGRDRVVVLGDDFWRGWLAASPSVLGQRLTVNGVSFEIVGVAPPSFRGVTESPDELYLPAMMLGAGYRWCDDALAADCTILSMIGRLAPGRTLAQARAEMETLVPERWAHAAEGENEGIEVVAARGGPRDPAEARLVTLLALAAGALLLVCCANLAGLSIARGSARSGELAIRASLGATEGRLLRQLLTESLLLASAGGAAGILCSLWMTRLLGAAFYSLDSEGHPLHFDFSLQPAVVLAVLALALLAGLLFGAAPALRSIRLGRADGLDRRASPAAARTRLDRWLVGAQAAVAVALATLAALLSAGAWTLVHGAAFEPAHVALLRLRPRLLGDPPEKAQRFDREVVRRLAALPGIESVSLIGTGAVLRGGEAEVTLPEWESAGRKGLAVGYSEIGPRYFETLGVAVLAGRELDERDRAGSPPVALVSQALARRLWPRGSALGSTLLVGGLSREVVGVVADVAPESRAEALTPHVYASFWQDPEAVDARLCARVRGDPAAMLPALVREAHRVDPDVPISEAITLPAQLAGRFRPLRLGAAVLTYAGGLTLLLTALGLYGALALAVSRRTREIGIRMAIGAEPRRLLAMVLGQGMSAVLLGVAAGLGLAAAAVRLLRHSLYGPATHDPLFYALAAALVTLAGLLAAWLPARRAARVDPLVALREE